MFASVLQTASSCSASQGKNSYAFDTSGHSTCTAIPEQSVCVAATALRVTKRKPVRTGLALPNHCSRALERSIAMRTFILLIAASTAVAFAPPQRMPAMTQMTSPVAAAPVAASRAVHKSNCRGARHRRDVSTTAWHTGRARRRRWRPRARRPRT